MAYHEAGHAVVGWFLQFCEPLLKVGASLCHAARHACAQPASVAAKPGDQLAPICRLGCCSLGLAWGGAWETALPARGGCMTQLAPLSLPQVSIVPRGSAALGFAQYLPNENMLMTTEQVRG